MEGERLPLTDRVHRLDAVERKLRAEKPVGGVDASTSWIEGTASAAAASFSEHEDVIFFFSNEDGGFLALAGSAHHVIGNLRAGTALSSRSHLHTLLDTLAAVATRFGFVVQKSDEALAAFLHAGVTQLPAASSWTQIMLEISRQFEDRPKQTISFLARRLTSEVVGPDEKRYTLATPLYVTVDDTEEPS